MPAKKCTQFILTMNSKRSVKPFQRYHDFPENHENISAREAGGGSVAGADARRTPNDLSTD
jgi:hypothetical protein